MFRHFATLVSREISRGDVIKRNDHYLEVLSARDVQKGEGQGMHLEYMDMQTHKRGKLHLKSTESAEKADIKSYPVEVESFDSSKNVLLISDARHNRIEIPAAFASWAKSGVKAGTLLNLILEGENFVKLTLPVDVKVTR